MTPENYIEDHLALLSDEECAELDWSTRSDAPYRGEAQRASCFVQWDEAEEEQEQEEEDLEADVDA